VAPHLSASPAQVFALLAGVLQPHAVGDPDLRRASALALRKAIREASPACKRELDALGLDAGHAPASACSVGPLLMCGAVMGAVAMWVAQLLMASSSPAPSSN
jgi:hypothetical protein